MINYQGFEKKYRTNINCYNFGDGNGYGFSYGDGIGYGINYGYHYGNGYGDGSNFIFTD